MAKKELMIPVNEETLAELSGNFPKERGYARAFFPRIKFQSQDVLEGEGKSKHVSIVGGTFFLETQAKDENGEVTLDESGKGVWEREELGDTMQGVIVFQRKQLRYYDESTEQYTSSPIFDNDDEVIPLYRDGAEVDRGTATELRALPEYASTTQAGKPSSKLEENRILYVLHKGTIYQLNLRGSSMYSYLAYLRKARPTVSAVLTTFGSEPKSKGTIDWNQMTFNAERVITDAEATMVLENQREIIDAIAEEKSYFKSKAALQ